MPLTPRIYRASSSTIRIGSRLAMAAALVFILAGPRRALASNCENLQKRQTPQVNITLAQSVPAGGFSEESVDASMPEAQRAGAATFYKQLPAFCRVVATLTPTKESNIHIEVWMPSENWNGKFLGVGNGSWGGVINYSALAQGLKQGYAVASTDDGTSGIVAVDSSTWSVLSNTERLKDFGFRSTHLMTLEAKRG